MMTESFLHSGDQGDLIAGLGAIKQYCDIKGIKAKLYLDCQGGMSVNSEETNEVIRFQSKGYGLKFNDRCFDFLFPLLADQDYIETVEKYYSLSNIHIDHNMNDFRRLFLDKTAQEETNQNLLYLQQKLLGLPIGYCGPWLTAKKFYTNKKIGLCRSNRYHSSIIFSELQAKLHDQTCFLGTELEYKSFCETIPELCKPEHYKTETARDLAIVLNSVQEVWANGTLAYWIALGLGKPLILHELALDISTTLFGGEEKKHGIDLNYCQGSRLFHASGPKEEKKNLVGSN